MNRSLLVLKKRLPSLLLAVYIYSFWALPSSWNEDNLLDGSWRYALGKFRGLGFSLGRDSWFTYGPIAHWFGPPMGSEQFQPFPFYLLGLLVAAIIGVYSARIFDSLGLSFRAALTCALLFPISFLGMEGSQEGHFVIALFFILIAGCLRATPDIPGIVLIIILGVCGLLYKLSLGMMSLFTLSVLLVSLCIGKKIGGRVAALCLAGYLALLYALFVLTSGSSDLLLYLSLGLETANKYSEIMVRNLPFSPPNYIIALVYLCCGGALAWQASKKMAGRSAALCFIIAWLGATLLLFKHGLVRADFSHLKLFYGSVTPVLAMLAALSWKGFGSKNSREKALLCAASLVLVVIYGVMLKMLPGDTSLANLPRNWLGCGSRLAAGMRGQSPDEFRQKSAFVRNSQPRLFSRLNEYSRSFGAGGRKPRITFYPWETLLFEGVSGYDLAPSPSLQLYSTGPHSRAHRLEAEFLGSARRPDIVVLGPSAIDNRSPVSELTDLLPPLYAHYRLIDVVEGYSILEARATGKSADGAVRCDTAPLGGPGEFLRLTLAQPGSVNPLLWRLAATLFKSPELTVAVTLTYADDTRAQFLCRGYLSQLRQGVCFAPEGIAEFLGTKFPDPRRPAAPTGNGAAIRDAVAELRRGDGFWNLPVIPRSLPLTVSYCSFR